ncbi:MAG: hypothetical protein IT326_01830 [Anaerolineae bacterium]|nr:hypothetical protein [Anaerolineae bacterium]
MRRNATLGRLIFFGAIALAFLSEFAFTALGGFLNLGTLSQTTGLEAGRLVRYLLFLSLQDLIGGISALMVFRGCIRPDALDRARGALQVLLPTMGVYAVFQILAGILLFKEDLRPTYIGLGVVYGLAGIAAWFIGRSLYAPVEEPKYSRRSKGRKQAKNSR